MRFVTMDSESLEKLRLSREAIKQRVSAVLEERIAREEARERMRFAREQALPKNQPHPHG
jgi:hypothetical protein